MNYILRPYQQEAVNKGLEFFRGKSKKNVIEVLPTGSGKSLVIANIAKELDGKLIIFQPSKELLEQNFAKYISYGEFAEIYSASAGRKKIAHVTFATIGSVVNKPELFGEFQYCIVDECHLVSPDENTMYKKFFDSLKLKVLGLTATPIRMKRYNFPIPHAKICMLDRMRPKFFNEYIYITQISEMKENKYFADIDYFSFDFDESKLMINSTGGDYTERSISLSLMSNSVLQKITNLYNDICCKGIIKHILIFVESIESAFELQKMIGINNCGVVTGSTPKKERADTLKLFKDGRLKCVANVGVLTTGFDFPELDCIIGARPTMSLGLYYQIIGRCVRPHPNKIKAYVFDFVGNFKRFGKVDNLIIEKKENLWCIHNGEKILTNNDISGRDLDVYNQYDKSKDVDTNLMTFGKYKGQELKSIPNSYWDWFLKEIQKNKYNQFIFNFIEQNILITK
jgi:DNA repair protein RadD